MQRQHSHCFFPFRDAFNDLTLDGKHLPKFQAVFASRALDKHEHHFVHAQESHDSFNCGRTEDILESISSHPKSALDANTNGQDPILMEMEEECVDNIDIIISSDSLQDFHDANGRMIMHSTVIVESGSHNCGKHLINPPIAINCCAECNKLHDTK